MVTRTLTLVLCLLLPVPAFAQCASDHQRREAWRHYRAGQELMAAEQYAKAISDLRFVIRDLTSEITNHQSQITNHKSSVSIWARCRRPLKST